MAPWGLCSATWTEGESGGLVVGWWSWSGPESSGLPWARLLTQPAVPGAWPWWPCQGLLLLHHCGSPWGGSGLGGMGAPGWVCLHVTQAGCRGLELVALFSPSPAG